MNSERWAAIDRLFNEALNRPGEERELYVRESAPDDEVASRVIAMLGASDAEHTGFDAGLPVGGIMDAIGSSFEPPATGPGFLPEGYRIGPFEVERLIATGGMGAVYAAARVEGGVRQRVAVKLLRRPSSGVGIREGETEKRFLLERQVLASLRHPSITGLLDVGTTGDGRPYLVMEYVDGLPIDTFCRQRGLSDRAIAELLARVCDAVQHAHQSLVLHRDLKPQNILVCDDGTPKVLDFGVARLLDPESDFETMNTRSGEFLGTLAYAAPEQLKGERSTDTRCDIFALGVIMYRLLTGELPHGDSKNLAAYLERIERARVAPPSQRRASIAADIDAVVRQAMAKDRERRYQSARELAGDLRRYARGEPVEARSDSSWYVIRSEIKRRRVPILAASIVLLASVLFGVQATFQANRLRDRTLELETALHENQFREGRLLGQAGNVAAAEAMLWACADAEDTNPLLPRLAAWGLRDLYRRHPIDATLRLETQGDRFVGAGPDGIVFATDSTGPSLVAIGAALERRLVRDGFAPVSIVSDVTTGALAWLDEDGALWTGDADSSRARSRATGLPPDATLALSSGAGVVTALSAGRLHGLAGDDPAWTVDGGVQAATVSATGRIFGVCADGVIREWDARGGELLGAWPIELDKGRPVITSDADGALLAFASGSEVVVVETGSGATRSAVAANGWVEAVCFIPDADAGSLVVTASADYGVRFWRADNLDLVAESTAHRDRPRALFPLGPGRGVLSVDRGGTGRVWRPGSMVSSGAVQLGNGTILGLSIHERGQSVLAALDDTPPRVVRHDFNAPSPVSGPASRDPVSAVGWLTDAESCIAATYGRQLSRLAPDGDGYAPVWTAELLGPANALAVSPDGGRVAVASRGVVEVFSTEDGAPIGVVELGADRTPGVRWRGGSIFAVTLPDSTVVRIDPETLASEVLFTDPTAGSGLRAIDVSDDAHFLAFAGDDAVIRVWQRSPAGWRPARELAGHREGVFDLAFGPPGVLASGSRSGSVRMWSLASGTEIGRFEALPGMVFDVEFHGDRLYAGGTGAVLRWFDTRAVDGRVTRNRPPQRSLPPGS